MSDLCPVATSLNATDLEDEPDTIGGSLLLLLESKKYCDVIFTFPSVTEKIEAHEFVLKARSPVFEQIFRMRKSGNVEGNEIEISECTLERFQQFLEFIYADKLDPHWTNIARTLDLLQLSHKYKVRSLTKKCQELLETEIPIVDSVKVFETARRYGRRELVDRAGQVMVKSFVELARTGTLPNAEEETLAYLLECDDLAVKEVGLFQIIVDWGRNQVGTSAGEEVLKNKLKNLISKIRYTNMAIDEFTKVVVPTGLLSAEDSLSVYTYLCGDEVTRRGLTTIFNTTCRKKESREVVTKLLAFYTDHQINSKWFPAFSKHCMSFKADRTQVDGKVLPDYQLNKTVITAVSFWKPSINPSTTYKGYVANINISIGEYSEPVKEGNFMIRFQKTMLNCVHSSVVLVSVEPPVELMSGRTYSVIVEDLSTSDLMNRLRNDSQVYFGRSAPNVNREAIIDLEDVCFTLKEIHRNTHYYLQNQTDLFQHFAIIEGITVGLA